MSELTKTTAPAAGPDTHADRLAAFSSRQRDQALAKYPELQRAYEIEDASRRFAERFVKDVDYQHKFQRMTDRYIRDKVLSREPLSQHALADQERREREREREHEQDIAR